MKKTYILYLFLLFILFGSEAGLLGQNSQGLTLQYCQSQAVSSFPTVKDKALLQSVTNLKINNLNAGFLPSLALNGQATYQSDVIDLNMPLSNGNQLAIHQAKDQYKATLDINQLIYDGGTISHGKKLEESSLATNLQQVEVDLFKVREQVNNVYFLLLSLQESQKLLETAITDLTDKEKVVESSMKNGVLIESDLDVLHAEKLKIEQQLADIQFNRVATLKILSILINQQVDENSHFLLPEVIVNDTLVVSRPEYKLFDLQNQQIEESKALTGTSRMPKVFAFAQGGYGRPGLNMLSDKFNPYYIVGASLKWTIWDWNKSSRDKQILDFQKQQIATRREVFDKNLSIDLQNKQASIQKLEQYLMKDATIVEIRDRVVKTAASRLEHGVITSNDYLIELNAVTSAKINFQLHKVQLEQAKINYLLAKGIF